MSITRPTLTACAVAALVAALPGCGRNSSGSDNAAVPAAPQKDEILWDTYGVPHVYGTTAAAVFYGYGYAQATEPRRRDLPPLWRVACKRRRILGRRLPGHCRLAPRERCAGTREDTS